MADKKTSIPLEFTPEQEARIIANTRARGMTFEVFLPESMADWLRAKIAAGMFTSPGEAAFVAFQDLQELDRHPAVRQALLTAMIEASVNDPRPGIPIEEVREQFLARMRKDANTDPPAPADLPEAIADLKCEARANGLTDAKVDAEIQAWRKEPKV
jgi:antitoxin ParD1/3/4